jgi:hypothetical protein
MRALKIMMGLAVIGSQVMRQPGFGFAATGGVFNAEVIGYDGFALAMYILGAWLIYRGFRPKVS